MRRLRAVAAFVSARRPRGLHGRLIVVVLSALALGLTLAAVATFMSLDLFLMGRADSQLTRTAQVADDFIARSMAAGHGVPQFGSADQGPSWSAMSQAGLLPSYLEIRSEHGAVLARSEPNGAVPQLPADLVARAPAATKSTFLDVGAVGGEWSDGFRVRLSRVPGTGDILVLAMPVGDIHVTMKRLAVVEIAVWVLTFALVGTIATRRIRAALRPLDRIGAEAYAIGAGELDRRVAPTDPRTEVGRLGIAVNTMLGRLESAFAERRASEDRLRRFVADASHELRTPLTSIRGYAELFRRGAADRPQDLAVAMARIESEATRMGVLVDELLLLARLDSGRPLESRPVDLATLAADAASDFQAAAPQRLLDLDINPREPVVIPGDADRLRQVLANLLTNVRRHTPPHTRACLSVRADTDKGVVVIEVRDDGPGLTREQCEHVFERFYRADASRTRTASDGGAGLGLSIVAAVAASHGGHAEVASTPGRGAVFTVVLPRP